MKNSHFYTYFSIFHLNEKIEHGDCWYNQSLKHLSPHAFPLAASYLDTLGLYSFNPLATACLVPEAVEVQYIAPAVSPLVKAQVLLR